jgi:sulfatase modifying factor 1
MYVVGWPPFRLPVRVVGEWRSRITRRAGGGGWLSRLETIVAYRVAGGARVGHPARVTGTMIRVAAGRVRLSDRRTEKDWEVDLDPYLLAAEPVTQADYAEVTGSWPSSIRGERLPVESVSWWDAVRYCDALSERDGLTPAYRDGEWDRGADGYRLPTEAEWEYACRAGTTGPRYGELDAIAWHRGNSGERPHEVGTREPNSWGFHDMLGNVWDWCWDIYDARVYGEYRVLRGGGWFDEKWSCRASVRRRSHPDLRIEDVGFRVARSVGQSADAAGESADAGDVTRAARNFGAISQ